MMVLKISFFEVAVPVLLISITVLILVIAFRKLRIQWGIGEPQSQKFAILYSMEKQPVTGKIELYYEIEEAKNVEIWLVDNNMNDKIQIDARAARVGGNKVNFDSKVVPNGRYFYELRSDNQKTSKAIFIEN
jgi:hypothetical protein